MVEFDSYVSGDDNCLDLDSQYGDMWTRTVSDEVGSSNVYF